MANLSPEENARGVITASTSNHSQSIAFGARLFGVRSSACPRVPTLKRLLPHATWAPRFCSAVATLTTSVS